MGRVRAAKSKVRTGCRTCKARRVKCDEAKPDCNRCSSTGRECGGYEIIAPKAVSHGQPPRIILPGKPPGHGYGQSDVGVARLPSTIPGATTDEMNYFGFFCRYTAPTISGAFPSQFFERFVLQLSMREPMVRHAATALGALQRAQERNGRITLGQEEAGFALRQYGEAISLAREKLLAPDLPSQRLELVACALFVCFEIAQKRFRETAMHLENGMNLLVNVRHKGHLPPGWDTDDFDSSDDVAALDREIARTFDRLDIQSTFIRSTRPKLSTDPVAIARRTPKRFASLEQAREYLSVLTRSISTFRHEVRATPSPFNYEDQRKLEVQQVQIRDQMNAWNIAFDPLRLSQVPLPLNGSVPQDVTARAVLESMALSANILLETGVADGVETIFDNFTSEFRLIVDLCQVVKDHPRQPASASLPNGGPSFHVHMACVPTVYIVALKCRDPIIRRRALDLLETFPFREGMWDAPLGARLCRHVMQLEESGYEDLSCAQDLPEKARIHEAMFDVTDWEDGIKCYYKRRDFEGEYGRPGTWLNWSGRAQGVKTWHEEPEYMWNCSESQHFIRPETDRCMSCGRLSQDIRFEKDENWWTPSRWEQPPEQIPLTEGHSSSGDSSPFDREARRSPSRPEIPGRGPPERLLRRRTQSTAISYSNSAIFNEPLRIPSDMIDFARLSPAISASSEQLYLSS